MSLTPAEIEKLRNRLAARCAQTEYCTADIRHKLLTKGCTQGEAQSVIDYLVHESFIDDSRYARAFAADKFRFAHWGRTKIRYALLQKGIAQADIDESVGALPEEEYSETLAAFIRSKAASIKAETDYAKRQKIARSAIARGFEPSLVFEALRLEELSPAND